MEMVRVGVIGVGSMGQNHARVYFQKDDVTLVAIADSQTETADKISRHYNCRKYADYREMLAKEELDAVSIAVPTSLHHAVALYALSQKKHVLLEKPIASNEQQAKEIIACAQNNQVKLMIGHIERFNTAVLEAKRRLDRGDIGELYKIEVQRIGPFPNRISDVGVITDLSVHDLDIIQYLMNAEAVRIYAEKQQKLHPTCEDSVTGLIQYTNGVLALLNINYLSPTKIRQLKIFGKRGMFEVNYLDQELFFYENNSFVSDNWESVSEGDMKKIILKKKEPLQEEIEAFIDCIRNDTAPAVSGEHSLRILSLANKMLEAADQKKVITLQ